MLTKFDVSTVDDWAQRYNGTYAILHDSDKNKEKHIVYFTGLKDNNVNFTDINGLNLSVRAGSSITFEFIPLRTGWMIGDDGEIYFVRRVPQRQWKRGICPENTSLNRFLGNPPKLNNAELSFGLVASILLGEQDYNASYYKWKIKITNKCALNRYFAIAGERVYFMNKVVGTIKEDEITLDETICKQELQDCITRGFYQLKVM